ncbi:MAG TPA: hypothetical protein VIY08_04440 [Candidatus Nitrosocosmicus sp.]
MSKKIFECNISKERNMIIAERFLSRLVKEFGKLSFSTDEYPEYHRGVSL